MNKTNDERVNALQSHADAWKDILEQKTYELFKSFGNEPITNKTAIVCTAALIELIQSSVNYLGSISDESHPQYGDRYDYRAPVWEPESLTEYTAEYRRELLLEAINGTDYSSQDVWDAHCNAHNLSKIKYTYRRILGRDGEAAANAFLDRVDTIVAESPLPNNGTQTGPTKT